MDLSPMTKQSACTTIENLPAFSSEQMVAYEVSIVLNNAKIETPEGLKAS